MSYKNAREKKCYKTKRIQRDYDLYGRLFENI